MLNQDVRAFAQLSSRLSFARKARTPDVVYVHGLSDGMISSCKLFELAVEESGRSSIPIAFNGDTAKEASARGWMGAEGYKAAFIRLGIPETKLFPTAPGIHTRSECNEFMSLAKREGFLVASIVAPPYHWPRVMACLVGSMAMYEYRIAAHFTRPHWIEWNAPMVGSQGREKNSTFLRETADEVERFCSYLEHGREENGNAWRREWGAPIDRIMEYLDWRDSN